MKSWLDLWEKVQKKKKIKQKQKQGQPLCSLKAKDNNN